MEMNSSNQPVNSSDNPIQPQPISHPVNNQKGFFPIILGALVLLVAVGAGAYYLGTQQNKPTTSSSNVNQTANNQVNQNTTPTNVPEPTSTTTIPGWESYVNTKNSYFIQYPPSFEIVKGPVPESELPTLDNISFSGMSKSSDSNSGVVLGISVNPSDANGKPIQCMTNDDCLNQWMAVLKKGPNEVTSITKTIMGKNVKGFEYQNKNSLYTQTNQYFVYLDNGKVWNVSITMNNYNPQEVAGTINQILSTFKYSK